jgi:hypothetical protein
LKIDHNNRRILITYVYWESNFDEWISNISERISPLNTHTYFEGGELKEHQRVEVLDELNNWLEAFVVEAGENQVFYNNIQLNIFSIHIYCSF